MRNGEQKHGREIPPEKDERREQKLLDDVCAFFVPRTKTQPSLISPKTINNFKINEKHNDSPISAPHQLTNNKIHKFKRRKDDKKI